MDELAASIRDRLALERQRLDEVDPGALDEAADLLANLHREFRGEIAALARPLGRGDRYLRGELLGEHGMPVEDLCALRRQRPVAVAHALRRWLEVPEEAAPAEGLGSIGARLTEGFAGLAADLLRRLADGNVSLADVSSLTRNLDQLEDLSRDMRVALIRRRP